MTKNIDQQVKSPSDLYYDFFCLLHLPVICPINDSNEEEQQSISCPLSQESNTILPDFINN